MISHFCAHFSKSIINFCVWYVIYFRNITCQHWHIYSQVVAEQIRTKYILHHSIFNSKVSCFSFMHFKQMHKPPCDIVDCSHLKCYLLFSEVDNCDESGYCLHGGTCFNYREYGLRCVCPEEYTGSHCEIKSKFIIKYNVQIFTLSFIIKYWLKVAADFSENNLILRC